MSKLQKTVKDREAWHAAVHRAAELDTTYRPNNNKAQLTRQEEKGIVTLWPNDALLVVLINPQVRQGS